MPTAKCVRNTRHYKVGDTVELGSADHPFIRTGDFVIVEAASKKKPIVKPKPKKRR